MNAREWRILLSKLAEEDLLPGVRQAYAAKRQWARLLWLLLLLGSLSLTVLFVASIVGEFLETPTTTRVSIDQSQTEFFLPDINICPSDWRVLPNRVLSPDEVRQFADGWYFFDQYLFKGWLDEWPDVNRSEAALLALMKHKGMRRYQQMMELMSWNASQVFLPNSSLCYGFEKVVDYNNSLPLCYKLRTFPWRPATEDSLGWRQLSVVDPLRRVSAVELVIQMTVNGQPPVILPWQHDLRFRISKRQHRRLNTFGRRCLERPPYVGYSVVNCRKFCFERLFFTAAYNCSRFLYVDASDWTVDEQPVGRPTLCKMHDLRRQNSSVNTSLVVQQCAEECRPLCHTEVFDYQLASARQTPFQDRTDLWILYESVINGQEVLEEIPSYSWISAISDVGGQLGLWTGACFMTVLELGYVVGYFFWKLGRKNAVSARVSDEFRAEELVRRIRLVLAQELFDEMLMSASPDGLDKFINGILSTPSRISIETTDGVVSGRHANNNSDVRKSLDKKHVTRLTIE